MAGLGKSLRALRVLLACLLLGAAHGAIAARPAAPIVRVDAGAEPAARREVPAAAQALRARASATPRPGCVREAAAAQVRQRIRTHGPRATRARKAPARPSYLLRHALLR